MNIYAVANQKGGVGKTTSTFNLGAALSELGKTVLLLDLDPQSGLSVSFGLNPDKLEQTAYSLLLGEAEISDVVQDTALAGVKVIPANLDLAGAELELIQEFDRNRVLMRELERVNDYDFVLIDCPPTLGVLTINALVAANRGIVPVQTQYLAFRALKQLRDLAEQVRNHANPSLTTKILRTMYDRRTRHSQEILEELEEVFDSEIYETVIPRTVKFDDASLASQPVITYAGHSEAANAYRALAKEIIHETSIS